MLKRYIKTVPYSDLTLGCFADRVDLRPGQWVSGPEGIRGQYMGITKGGVVGIRWQTNPKFTRDDAKKNKLSRQYVRTYE